MREIRACGARAYKAVRILKGESSATHRHLCKSVGAVGRAEAAYTRAASLSRMHRREVAPRFSGSQANTPEKALFRISKTVCALFVAHTVFSYFLHFVLTQDISRDIVSLYLSCHKTIESKFYGRFYWACCVLFLSR